MLTFITESCFYSQVWHLVRHDSDSQKDSERSNKLVSEIYLTRYASPTVALALAFLRLTDLVWVDGRRRGSEWCNELSVANSVRLGVAALHSLAACSLLMTVDFFKLNGDLEIKGAGEMVQQQISCLSIGSHNLCLVNSKLQCTLPNNWNPLSSLASRL